MKPEAVHLSDSVTIYHADCRDVMPVECDTLVTDPPYGIRYNSGYDGSLPRGIAGDCNADLRDWIICEWAPRPMACFATWRCRSPISPRGCLVWHKAAGGMGDLSFPWRPTFEMIWIFGKGWTGRRNDAVLTGRTVVTWNDGPAHRLHPHEKPHDLVAQIVRKAPGETILDPFMGSGTTGVACIRTGRKFIGVEIDAEYFEIAKKRLERELAQGRLDFGRTP